MAGFQEIYASRMFGVKGAAAIGGNFDGPFIPTYKILDSSFVADASESDWVSTTGSNGLTLSHTAVDGGSELMTMGGTNDDCGEFYHTAQWSAASAVGGLFKLKISQITAVCVCAGFVDAYENTNDHVAIEMSATALRNCSNTADFAGMVFDTDATNDYWYCGCSNNGTEATPVLANRNGTTTLAPSADTFFYISIQTNSDGDVNFYYGTSITNLAFVGHQAAAIAAASTNLLTPYVGFIAREATAETCTISRIIVWQEN